MKSINFEILSQKWPVLSNLGAFSEQYAQPDPSSALVKLRTYAETMTHWIYGKFGFPISANPNFYDLLDNDAQVNNAIRFQFYQSFIHHSFFSSARKPLSARAFVMTPNSGTCPDNML